MKRGLVKLNLWSRYFTIKEQFLLLSILVVGLAIRIITAVNTLLWRDEVYIFFTSKEHSIITLLTQNHWDTAHPPLYFIFLHFWQMIDDHPFFLRLPSLILSVGILYLIPVVARKLNDKSKLFPFFSLIFFSLSHSQISLNVVVRPYPFAILFMLTSIILFLGIVQGRTKSLSYIILFAVINFFVFFSDYSGVWLLVSYVAYGILCWIMKRGKNTNRALLKSLGLSLLMCSFWIYILVLRLPQSFALEKDLMHKFRDINPVLANIGAASFFTSIPNMFPGHIKLGPLNIHQYMLIALTVLAAIGLFLLMRRKNDSGLFLLLLTVVPIITSFTFSLLIYPIFLDRNLLIVNIAFIYALSFLAASISSPNLLITAIFVFLWGTRFFAGFPQLHFVDPPYDWIKVVDIIKATSGEKAVIGTQDPLFMYEPLRYYNIVYGVAEGKRQVVNVKSLIQHTTVISYPVFFIQTEKYHRSDYKIYEKFARNNHCRLVNKNVNNLYFAECEPITK